MDTKLLESLLADAMPAMDGLKRIPAEDWSVDMPGDGGWSFLGREDNSPRIIVIERGFGRSADARHNAIESLIALAPALAREVIDLRRKVAGLTIDIAVRDATLAGAAKVKPLERSAASMSNAPKDRPILAWCENGGTDTTCPYCDTCQAVEGSGHRLCLYHAHAEGLSAAPTGFHIIVWGGAFDDSTWEYPNQASLPDWWFVEHSEFEMAANPTMWWELPYLVNCRADEAAR